MSVPGRLEDVVRQTIVDTLTLSIPYESIAEDAPLFGPESTGGLGLDSLSSLEILAALSDKFQSPLDDIEPADFFSVFTLAEYLRRQSTENANRV